jgi:AcrR family transcriptional regulator
MAGRTSPMTRVDRRKQLLKIARQLVAKEGMGALTMMALSEQAKVAKPVVYSHFANRAEVAIALLDEHFEVLGQYVREHLAGAATLEQYFSRLVDASFDFEGPSDIPVRKITNGFTAGDEVNQAFLRHEEAFRKHWEQLLELFGVRRESIEVAAYALHGMMDNTVYTFAITPQHRVARNALKAMLLAALGSLAPDRKRKLRGVPAFFEASNKTPSKAADSKRPAESRRLKRRAGKNASGAVHRR